MEDTLKFVIIAAVIGLLIFLYCRQQKRERMVVAAPNVMPRADLIAPIGATDPTALQPADTDTMDYGAYPSTGQPCATAVPYS